MKFYDVAFSAIGDESGPEASIRGDEESRWLRLKLASGTIIMLLPGGEKGLEIVSQLADQINEEVDKARAQRSLSSTRQDEAEEVSQ